MNTKIKSKKDLDGLSQAEINERWGEIKEVWNGIPNKPWDPAQDEHNPIGENRGNGYYVIAVPKQTTKK